MEKKWKMPAVQQASPIKKTNLQIAIDQLSIFEKSLGKIANDPEEAKKSYVSWKTWSN